MLAGFPFTVDCNFEVDCILLIDIVEREDCAVPGREEVTLYWRSRFYCSIFCWFSISFLTFW